MANITHTFPKGKKFVAVLWFDPHSLDATEIVNEEDTHKLHRSLPMISHGYVLKEDEEGISLASEYCGNGDFRNSTFISRPLIVEVVPQGTAKKKRV